MKRGKYIIFGNKYLFFFTIKSIFDMLWLISQEKKNNKLILLKKTFLKYINYTGNKINNINF